MKLALVICGQARRKSHRLLALAVMSAKMVVITWAQVGGDTQWWDRFNYLSDSVIKGESVPRNKLGHYRRWKYRFKLTAVQFNAL